MQSVMRNFQNVPTAEIPRAKFDRSHGHKTTFDADYLIPIFLDEALPGDTFTVRMAGFARMATPIYPVMDNMRLETFFFSVPVRQLWTNFRKFMGERVDPADSIDYTIPIITSTAVTGYSALSVYDYMGIPTEVPDLDHSALFLRAMYHVWNEWFRNQNIQDSLDWDDDDGPDLPTDYTLLKRNKRHDYFTSGLPWPQKGDAVSVPLGTVAPVKSDMTVGSAGVFSILKSDGSYDAMASSGTYLAESTVAGTQANRLYADLSTATASTINQLRQSFQIQKLLERDARSGTRYAELVHSHFGVNFMDVTYRPEYLGGGSTLINVTPIAATDDAGSKNVGELSGMGTSGFDGHGFTKSFTEHCILIGFVNVRADLTYQQGLNRMWSRSTRYDFYWPALAQIGEQSVLTKEIYAQGTSDDDLVFAYQERYAEYRYKPSLITGQFRSNHATSLDPWHLSEEFGSRPTLSNTFIQSNTPVDRVIAVPAEPHFILDSYFDMSCVRPMPLYGVPGLIDHF